MPLPSLIRDLAIDGMTCASCVGRVERQLAKVPGVEKVAVNLANERARVTLSKSAGFSDARLIDAVNRAGFDAVVLDETAQDSTVKQDPIGQDKVLWRDQWLEVTLALTLALPLTLPMIGMMFDRHWPLSPALQCALATPVQFWFGRRLYREAWKAIVAVTGTMELLVALGSSAAFGLSLWLWLVEDAEHLYFEASAVVIALVLLGKRLEKRARARTLDGLKALMALRPATARKLFADGSEQEIPIASIQVGDRILVRPGEQIPVDGVVCQGETSVNEAFLTGESRPIAKSVGDSVAGGALNGEGAFLVETKAVGAESVLGRIVRLVEEAQMAKAPIQRLVDRVASAFVPAVLGLATIACLGWLSVGAPMEVALIRAVAVLVIACPCALGLATPTALIVGIGVAARHGILIRDAGLLEQVHRLTAVLFDKTGTLTEGMPVLRRACALDGDDRTLIRLAAEMQAGSEHPLARAIEQAAGESASMRMLTLTAAPGLGVRAQASDGRVRLLGNAQFMHDNAIVTAPLQEAATAEQEQGATLSWLAECAPQTRLIGFLSFCDAVRPTAPSAIAQLQARGLRVALLSGDNAQAAKAVAVALGITDVQAPLLPADKAAAVTKARRLGPVAMVGDGINDAPSLAAADLSIAMSSGADLAMTVAGITLVRQDLRLVAASFDISYRTYRKIQQNLLWAFLYNLIAIPLAMLGLLSPVIAGAAMAASSVSVVVNSLLLRRWQPQFEERRNERSGNCR